MRDAVAAKPITAGPAISSIAAIIASAVVVWWQLQHGLWSDVTFYIAANERLLNGGRLYVDIIDMNLPMAFWSSMPPVWVASATGLDAVTLTLCWTVLVILLSLVLTWHQLTYHDLTYAARLEILCLIFAVLIAPAGPVFGQREHVMVALTLPYYVMVAPTLAGSSRSIPHLLVGVTALAAAIGFSIKPYFLIPLCMVEATILFHRKSLRAVLRPETIIVFLLLLAYAIAALVLTPEYFTTILPLARATYDAYVILVAYAMSKPWIVSFCLLAPVAAYFAFRGGRERPLPFIFAIVGFSSFAAFLAQFKGWPYHLYPAVAFLSISVLLILFVDENDRIRRITAGSSMRIICAFIVALQFFSIHLYWEKHETQRRNIDDMLVRRLDGAQSVMLLSHDLGIQFPMLRLKGLTWASSFPAAWSLVGFGEEFARTGAPSSSDASRRWAFRFSITKLVDDFIRYQPEGVIVDIREYSGTVLRGTNPQYLRMLATDPRFDEIWRRYELVSRSSEIEIYHLRPTPSPAGGAG